ncbi:flagellin N-terminal helical domain-containing protein [Oceanobacillus sojae]|uniref:flagellin N-terminal helical domain-containing protein n=1 Tax=Oceanobacillus sojae TaxID=582851 RepID=UPI0009886E02|nr:flagellin [Oceanobacillus sojae]
MIINHNISAINAHRQLGVNQNGVQGSLEKLSSGLQINRAGDDAAGLAISEKMRGQIRGLEQASTNAQDGISLIQTAEGALNETHDILQRMRELAVQSSNDSNTDADREEIQKEVDQLAQEISRISNTTEFNTQNLAGGGFEGTFHIGANSGQNIKLSIDAMDAHTLGVARDVTETTGTSDDFNNVKVGNTTGSAVVDGASVDVSVAAQTGSAATAAAGTHNGITLTADTAGEAGNINVVFATGAADDAELDGDTLTITLDSTGALDEGQIQDALDAGGVTGFTLSGTGTVANGENFSLAGGADEIAAGDGYVVTLTSGTTTETVDVSADATNVIGTGAFEGLSFNVDNLSTSTSGTINISSTPYTASAAQFNADGTIANDAVARGGVDVSTQETADAAITTIQTAINTVSAQRSNLGAVQNRLEHTINNLGASAENMTAAESRIRDVDMAKEMMNFTKNNILSQAAQSMLAQSQQMPQGVLQLLQ